MFYHNNTSNKAVATASVACGWAGAVMWGAGAVGGAVHTTTSVPSDWAGAVMRKPLANAEKGNAGQTDRQTDRLTDEVTCRVACTRLKTLRNCPFV